MSEMLFSADFEERACKALSERLLEAMPNGYYTDDVSFVTHNHGDDRLFSALVSVEKDGGDRADFSINVFPNGNSLIYCMDEDVFHPLDEEAIDTALKQGTEAWRDNDPYFSDMVTIKDAMKAISLRPKKKNGIEI